MNFMLRLNELVYGMIGNHDIFFYERFISDLQYNMIIKITFALFTDGKKSSYFILISFESNK